MTTKYYNFEFNKTKICIYPMKEVKAAFIDLRIRAGSAWEKPTAWGAFHLLEHMFHQGTHKFANREQIETYQEEHGLTSNAWTGSFDMGSWVKFPKYETNAAMELVDEMIFSPRIPENQIAREVAVIQQEYRDKWSNPNTRYNRAINNFLYGKGHVASRDGVGQPEYIKTITSEQLKALKNKYLQPQNMLISVAGDVDVKQVSEKLKNILEKEQNSGVATKLTKKDFKFKEQNKYYLNHIEDVQNVTINFVWHIDGFKKLSLRQRLAIGTAGYLLGSTRGLLFKRLRQELGLVYKTGTDRYLYEYTGGFEIWASTSQDKVNTVISEIKKIVIKFLTNKIPYSDFSRAVNYLDIQTLMSYDSVGSISQKISDNLLRDGRPISPEEYIKIAKPITEKEVRELLHTFIKPSITPYICIMSKEKINL